MSEHTPLPWWNESCVIHAANDRGGATHPANCTPVEFLDGDWDRATAGTEFIVLACNSHDGLLAALEGRGCEVDRIAPCLRVYSFLSSEPGPYEGGLYASPPCATCAAIAKAKGPT